jgi:hypothetical protein
MYKIRFQSNYALTQYNIEGEYTMQQVDTIQLVPRVSTIFNRAVDFFCSSRVSTPQTDPIITNIDWPDSDTDSKQSYYGSDNQPASGGYNEAFIVQHWAGYHLR